MTPVPINLSHKLSLFTEKGSPKIVAEMDGFQFKLAKLEGDFVWHSHSEIDEVFNSSKVSCESTSVTVLSR